MGGFSLNYGYHFTVPILRILLFWGLYWGRPILGNYHMSGGAQVSFIHGYGKA